MSEIDSVGESVAVADLEEVRDAVSGLVAESELVVERVWLVSEVAVPVDEVDCDDVTTLVGDSVTVRERVWLLVSD